MSETQALEPFTQMHLDSQPPQRRVVWRRLGHASVERFNGLLIWAAFLVVFAIWVPSTFLTSSTAQDILYQQSVTAIAALGILFPLAAGVYDLSIGTTLGLAAVVTARLTSQGHVGTVEVLAIALGLGLLIGLMNGLLVVGFGINSFIATLAMSSVLTAAIGAYTNGDFIASVPHSYQALTSHHFLGVPEVAFYVVVLALVAWYALEHAPFGRQLAASGFNPEASRLAGVSVGRLMLLGLIISATMAAAAGALLTSQLGTATPDTGPPYLLPAYAAAFLGSTQLKPGRFNAWGTLIAILLLATGVKGLQLAGASNWVTDLFNGVALMVAVGLSVAKRRERPLRQILQFALLQRRHTS